MNLGFQFSFNDWQNIPSLAWLSFFARRLCSLFLQSAAPGRLLLQLALLEREFGSLRVGSASALPRATADVLSFAT